MLRSKWMCSKMCLCSHRPTDKGCGPAFESAVWGRETHLPVVWICVSLIRSGRERRVDRLPLESSICELSFQTSLVQYFFYKIFGCLKFFLKVSSHQLEVSPHNLWYTLRVLSASLSFLFTLPVVLVFAMRTWYVAIHSPLSTWWIPSISSKCWTSFAFLG